MRAAAIDAIRSLSAVSPELAVKALDFLVDMLNDDTESVCLSDIITTFDDGIDCRCGYVPSGVSNSPAAMSCSVTSTWKLC